MKQIDADVVLSEIHKLKIAQHSLNIDYNTGYVSALSTVEGFIAILLNKGKDDA